MKRAGTVVAGLMMVAALAGCTRKEAKQPPLTERQRDSVLSTEPLPGASVVGGALKASDKAAADAAKTNAAVDSLPR